MWSSVGRWQTLIVSALALLFCSMNASADWQLNMDPGVTEISQSIYGLHMQIFYWCTGIGIVVFSVMIYSMLVHRKSRGAVAANFHESTTVELIWTIVPFIILIIMAIPATKTLAKIYDSSDPDMTVEVRGYQWKWQYKYLSGTDDKDLKEEISFFSNLSTPIDEIYNLADKGDNYLLEVDNPLVIPVNKKVRFLITANDVIHAWWVPAFGVKKDAIPGFVNEASTFVTEPGIYRGQCAELCGKDHGFMPIVVEVKSEEDYALWLAQKQEEAAAERELRDKVWTLDELMVRGEKVYASQCQACHQADGAGTPPVFPALKGSDIAINDMEKHIDVVVNGVTGSYMAAYGPQMSEVDLAAVITYERNAWGNNTGEMVTPLQILEFKEKK